MMPKDRHHDLMTTTFAPASCILLGWCLRGDCIGEIDWLLCWIPSRLPCFLFLGYGFLDGLEVYGRLGIDYGLQFNGFISDRFPP